MKTEERLPAGSTARTGGDLAPAALDPAARRPRLPPVAPAASLVFAALVGALIILLVQGSTEDVADVAGAMRSYGVENKDSLAFILAGRRR